MLSLCRLPLVRSFLALTRHHVRFGLGWIVHFGLNYAGFYVGQDIRKVGNAGSEVGSLGGIGYVVRRVFRCNKDIQGFPGQACGYGSRRAFLLYPGGRDPWRFSDPTAQAKPRSSKLLAGLLIPTCGRITVGGADIIQKRKKALEKVGCSIR